jgi:hypothetical protein
MTEQERTAQAKYVQQKLEAHSLALSLAEEHCCLDYSSDEDNDSESLDKISFSKIDIISSASSPACPLLSSSNTPSISQSATGSLPLKRQRLSADLYIATGAGIEHLQDVQYPQNLDNSVHTTRSKRKLY